MTRHRTDGTSCAGSWAEPAPQVLDGTGDLGGQTGYNIRVMSTIRHYITSGLYLPSDMI